MSGNFPDPQSTFLVQGSIAFDPVQGANFVFVTVRDGDKLYLDVSCFEDGPLGEFRNLRKGMQIKIAGYLGKRKVKELFDAKGRQVYETQLLARKVAIIGAPMMQQPPQPMYQPANPPGAPAMTYPQWVAQQQMPPAAAQGSFYQQAPPQQQAAPQQPQQPSHPASWDLDDKLAF